ncbi:MAG TPA: zinc ribbon domain-containing protein [Candidatus Krumholzibacteria bacterium]|nr:zinc ribbon domain-containing protein [Candidatus Krumholzibacteria bacterium]
MYCKFCGREVDEKAAVCPHCGKQTRSSFSNFLETSEFTRLKLQKTPKSPGLAGFLGFVLSWLCMGSIGYVYLGQWNWFFVSIVVYGVSLLVSLGTGYFLFPFLFAVHQYQMAQELNSMLAKSTPHPGDGGSGMQTSGDTGSVS